MRWIDRHSARPLAGPRQPKRQSAAPNAPCLLAEPPNQFLARRRNPPLPTSPPLTAHSLSPTSPSSQAKLRRDVRSSLVRASWEVPWALAPVRILIQLRAPLASRNPRFSFVCHIPWTSLFFSPPRFILTATYSPSRRFLRRFLSHFQPSVILC